MNTKWIVAMIITCIGFAAKAQHANAYWVIENNIHSTSTLIRFYDQQNNLIHAETMPGKKLKVTKRRHRKLLDQKLQAALQQEAITHGNKLSRN